MKQFVSMITENSFIQLGNNQIKDYVIGTDLLYYLQVKKITVAYYIKINW